MHIKDLQNICEKLIGTTQDIKWEDHLCFNVGGKMYLVTSPDRVPHTASFKTTDEDFSILCDRDGIIPAPYLARYKWVHIDNIEKMDSKDWEKYIKQSYELVFSKLPANLKKEITI